MTDIFRPEYRISTFSYAAELLSEYNIWNLSLSKSESKDLQAVMERTAALLNDIHLDPDRKYTVAEIGRLQTAIEWALGGGQ